ncbi:MAG: amidohydrolase family protein [Smithella sp.]|jgi:predicted TIM-barrel fold metal-dependent hydrolase
MIIDCHYHMDERMLKTDDLIARMDETGVERIALIASLCDPLPETPPIVIRILQFLLTHSSLRPIGKALAANFTDDGSINILGKIYKIYPDPDNEAVFKTIENHPDKFYGWIFVNPRGKNNPLNEISTWAKSPGFIGIKAHPFWHRYNPSELLPAAEQAVRLNKPLLLHLGFNEHGDILELINKLPDLKLLLAHAAFPCYSDTWKIIKEKKNICVDLSATAYVGKKITRDVVDYLGVDRCFYGTDGPFGPLAADEKFDYGYLKRRIEKLFLSENTQKLLLGENFARFAGI